MFWLIFVTVNSQNALLWLECRHVYVSLISAIVNNALFYPIPNSHIAQTLPQIILRFSGILAAPGFVMKCIEVRAVRSVARNLEVHMGLLNYCTFGLKAANDAQNIRVDTARGKDNDQQTLSKMIM